MSLIRLLYHSQAVREMSLNDLKEILDTARENNHGRDICGMLCYDNSYFLQILEGEAEAVTELFVTIANDDRHEAITILGVQGIDKAVFPAWDMGYAGNSEYLESLISEMGLDGFEPEKLTFKQGATLLFQLAKHQTDI